MMHWRRVMRPALNGMPKKALNPVHLIPPLISAIQNSFIFYYTIALFVFLFYKS